MHALMLWAVLASVPEGKEAPGFVIRPPAQSAAANTENREAAGPEKPPYTPDALKAAWAGALRQSGRRGDAEPAEIVPVLAALYVEIGRCEAMPLAERRRLQSQLATRMSVIRGDLIRQVAAERAAQRRRSPSPRVRSGAAEENQLAGGGANAIELIDLIQNTIAPESWQRAGGPGSISFYRPLNALVIRQSGEVHHQLGGLLGALRR